MTLRLSEEEYAELMRKRKSAPVVSGTILDMEPPKRRKYGNVPTVVDGIRFDSRKEANVYAELMLRVRAGELKFVCRQVRFDLPGGIKYVADFVTVRPDFQVEAVIDVKSQATRNNRVYINKKKQMKACWGIDITEI